MMKREILFKAKRIDNGEWVYGDLITDGKGSKFNIFHIFPEDADEYSFDHCVRVKTETVCQFTGLLDKNGNKIFEGDKLKRMNGKIDIVKFDTGQFVNVNEVGQYNFIAVENKFEIIGNIHD